MITEPLPADKFAFEHTYVAFDANEVQLSVGDPTKLYRYMSVTKPIAAWGILVAIAQGKFDLDTPAGPEGSTFRHLLSHASGLPADPGAPIAKPGRRRIYSNYGFDVMGQEAEQYIGMSIQNGSRPKYSIRSAWSPRASSAPSRTRAPELPTAW
ncbi:serine hydrolase [Trueperella pyogenes]|uniref:serine hydrolase domain-containing protein n=1 Tax=Trueperella pyogenes TaxID=1661 RepID=UPI003132E4A3